MADALSDNFCSLCGFSFFRFGSDNLNIKTSLASNDVENSGLLKKLNIKVSPLKEELIFICFACRNVFINYNHAKENFEIREKQAMDLLLGPVQTENKELLPFVPYLKRNCLRGFNSEVSSPKIQKLDVSACDTNSQVNNLIPKNENELKMATQSALPPGTNNIEGENGIKPKKVKMVRQETMAFVEKGRYRSALEKLWRNSKRFRLCCRSLISQVVKKETKELLKHSTLFTHEVGMNTIGDIDWQPTMNIVSKVAPTTLCLLSALLGKKLNNLSKKEERSNYNIIGCLLSQALYKRFKRKASFIPQVHSLYLHQNGIPSQVCKMLHLLGLAIPAGRLASILRERDAWQEEQTVMWKRELEVVLEGIHAITESSQKQLTEEKKREKIQLSKFAQVRSYGLCWGKIPPPKKIQDAQAITSPHREEPHKTTTATLPNPVLSQAYVAHNRVPFNTILRHNENRAADSISFEEFVPDSEDFLRVREQMEREVQKILVQHIASFNDVSVIETHRHSTVMSQSSCVVEAGRPFHHPTDNGSAASALKRLAGFRGQVKGELIPLVVYGGQEAVELAVGAKDVMSCFSDKADRLDGLEPAITDYGRDALLARDVISIFFPNGLEEKEGILKHLRLDPKFLRKCETTKNTTTIHSFIKTLAHYYTLALGEEKLTGVRTGKLSMCPEEKKKIVERIAEDIVVDVWPQIDSDSFDSVRQGNEPVADRECCYEDCVNYNENAVMACSERCGRPFYLCCRIHQNEGLVECGRRENCRRGAWFHLNRRCSGLLKAPRDDWLCRWCAPRRGITGNNSEVTDEKEGAWEYHRSLLWHCLLILVGRAAEGQGNGWLQHAVWKVCMPLFETRGHTQYLQQGYSFLSGVAGRIPRLTAHDMVHNRTVNLTGGPDSNMSWERAVRFLNCERKWTSSERGAESKRVPGHFAYSIKTAWERDICSLTRRREESDDPLKLAPRVALELFAGNILYTSPPPSGITKHTGHTISVADPHRMIKKLTELCRKDATRQMNEREDEVLE
ncbi:hypothetical protein Pcinc_039861 [Petrolisthes cinctipes]|uniref:Zinc finger PHD-type domain-containing protein n=1 Tax=Petrolisthes cinctipes TaxID=88211 RepID=A0AAE1BNB0_PETCI|nr:hypothetical protein Pcinc_039861 [Petrolisthes cinctipes]